MSANAKEDLIARAKTAVKAWPAALQLAALVAVVIGVGWLLLGVVIPSISTYVGDRADLLLKNARHLALDPPPPTLSHPPSIPSEVAERLERQLRDIQLSAHYHITVAKAFFRYQYVTLTIASTAAVLAGILLVPISWKGWKTLSPVLSTSFLVCGGIAALFTTYNQVYNQDATIEANTALYYGYLQLEDEILSYYARFLGDDETVATPVTLIKEIDARVGDLRSFAVELDASKIPTAASVAEQLQSGVSTAAPED